MEETHHRPQQTDSGAQYGQPTTRLGLPDGAARELGLICACHSFDTLDNELLNLVQSLIPLTGEGLDHWSWEERRDFLNWCLDEGVLTIQDGRLVPVGEDMIPMAPLTHDTDAQDRAEDAGFLRDVERTKPVIQVNSEISAKALANDLGLNSVVYAHTLKMCPNAHKSAQEGA